MTYDSSVPESLKALQEWFGAIISRPMVQGYAIQPNSVSCVPIELEAQDHIVPSSRLLPKERIEIYNQQYWWRLIRCLQEHFPLLLRLLGPSDFNQMIAIPYLVKCPPNHWSLTQLGERLPDWIQGEYDEGDKVLIYEAAYVDRAFQRSFLAGHSSSLSLLYSQGPDALLHCTLKTQGHIQLCRLKLHLFSFREELLKHDADHWLEHNFPDLKKGDFHIVLYRDSHNNCIWKELSPDEYHLLEFVHMGASINSISEWIGDQEPSLRKTMQDKLYEWLARWAESGWLMAP